jgi:nuclear factor related to kappa-B-binding protein
MYFRPRPELMQETQACFFSLIRDILTSTPDHRIEMRELESRVKAWANSPIGPINHWYTPHLESQLTSAVQFLAGDSSGAYPLTLFFFFNLCFTGNIFFFKVNNFY